jgi:hypothetical protein
VEILTGKKVRHQKICLLQTLAHETFMGILH